MALKFQDYYERLGVARTATAADIKKAFRKLARVHHPDLATDKVAGEAKFKDINEAYEVLGDPDKRKKYDELGEHWQDGPSPPGPGGGGFRARPAAAESGSDFEFEGTGYSDFFESYFGGARDGFGRGRGGFGGGPAVARGRDVEADLLVTLNEALHGAVRKITLRRSGENGTTERSDTYQVKIPSGVRAGQRIRLAGQGSAGTLGGAAGDLFLRVNLARHPDFTVQGADLHLELDLAPWEAVLGVTLTIPTLDGRTSLRVPPATANGSQLRLRGLGLAMEGGRRGDLYATARVQIPPTLTIGELALWEALAAKSTFNPRTPV